LFGIEWLRQEKHFLAAPIIGMERFLKIAGDEDDPGLGIAQAQPIGEMTAAHLWHHHVGKEQVKFVRTLSGDQLPSILAVGRFRSPDAGDREEVAVL
jgi:hypothetical protein